MQPLAKALMESGHMVTILQIADKEHPLHDAQCTERLSIMYAAFANLTATPWDLVIVDSIFAPCGMYVALQGYFVDYSTTIMYYKSAVAKRITSPLSIRPGTQTAGFESKRFLHLPSSLNFAQPTSNEVIVVDHPCQKKNSTLPENYRRFIEQRNSKGTILVAFGHAFKANSIPEQVRQAMLGAFLRLTDYRIIWQPAEQTEDLNASHIWPSKWVPQSDILAHPKTVAFVTHMGYKSFREGLCAQVPLVAMPIFAEQYFNTAVALQKGIGVFVNKMNISSEAMYYALRRVLNDRTIKQRMTRFSSQVNDQFIDPVDLATFWINFLLRHKNVVTKFLRQKGEDLNNIAMNNSDVFLFFASLRLMHALYHAELFLSNADKAFAAKLRRTIFRCHTKRREFDNMRIKKLTQN
ncbi:UDPGT domain containing protein [Trichuris trichiura]|uniref:glucuronosyltransferase n=1 Tax=Trichuris trichiura TaxID=36087 RepID=A0A077Z0Y1_TRITR|nr:UDPGT domain containing protein [Trichuris trichiura]